jgi:hypothetical protein
MANRRSWTGMVSCERRESRAVASERGLREAQILGHFNGAGMHASRE